MAEQLSDETLVWYRVLFNKFDFDKDGMISKRDLQEYCQLSGYDVDEKEIDKMILEVDRQKLKGISFLDFLEIVSRRRKLHLDFKNKQENQVAFQSLVQSESNMITAADLKEILQSFGDDLSDEDIHKMIYYATRDKEATGVTFDQLMSTLQK